MNLNVLRKILLHKSAQPTKVKPNRPSGDDIGVVGETLLGQSPDSETNALGVGIGEIERPIQGILNHRGNVLLIAILLVEEGKHLRVVLANDVPCECQDFVVRSIELPGTAPRNRAADGAVSVLGVVGLLHLRINHALLNVGGIAPHETESGRPELHALARTPTVASMSIDVEGGDPNLGADVIRLATELATLVDNHRRELLHNHNFQTHLET